MRSRLMLILTMLAVGAAVLPAMAPHPPASAVEASVQTDGCPPAEQLAVPGAEYSQAVCLEDLTTHSNTRRSTAGGDRGNAVLHSAATDFPPVAVPGVQIEGWFPDGCDRYELEPTSFVPACPGGLRHNSQFVIRIPANWDGRRLVVSGAPGVRDQWASDTIISDWVLLRGWAYAAHDKGNTGLNFFRAGDTETDGDLLRWTPPKAMLQWGPLMDTTARAAKAVLAQAYGSEPDLTYATGISNGGYQTRLAVENYPETFDGGIDWEGTLIRPEAPNLFTDVPIHLQSYPAAKAGDREAYLRMVHDSHLPPDSEPVWDYHWLIYWGSVASAYRPVIDPEYTEYVASPRTPVLPADPDAQYDYEARPDFVKERMAAIGNTGQLHGKPFITIGPTLDALLPIQTHSDVYAEMVRATGNGDTFRYYVVEGGNHVDPLADDHTDVMRPVLPCYLDAMDALDAWVVHGTPPPPSGFVPFPVEQTHEERANRCALPDAVDRVRGPDRIATAIAASRGAFTTARRVVLASAGDFPDALAAAPLAARLDAPVLLVGADLTQAHRREIQRLGAYEAVIVGGTAAVPKAVEDALAEEDLDVRRVFGATRFSTAAAIARELGDVHTEVVVASGERFPDALSIAPVAAAAGMPILLTLAGDLPAATAEALRVHGVETTLVVGGEGVVGADVASRLPSPRRLAGSDRYATSAAVARFAVERGADLTQIGIATGRRFPDALAAGPVLAAGYGGSPGSGIVLLVDGERAAEGPAHAFLAEHRARIQGAVVFGGTAAVNDAVAHRVRASLR